MRLFVLIAVVRVGRVMIPLNSLLDMIATDAIEEWGEKEDEPQQPNDCDICSNNFLSHTIHFCPDCGLCYCDRCWDTEHHCYDDDDDEDV